MKREWRERECEGKRYRDRGRGRGRYNVPFILYQHSNLILLYDFCEGDGEERGLVVDLYFT